MDKLDHVVMPGLINMHAHAAMSLFKGFSDDKSLMDWLRIVLIYTLDLEKDIWPAEGKFVGPEFVIDVGFLPSFHVRERSLLVLR